MKKLLKKEFTLAMHPSTVIFMLFAPMLLIPDYMYMIVFFYASMGIFFTCLQGRENNDVLYSVMLPVKKSDTVKARYMYAAITEMIVIAECIPFVIMSQSMYTQGDGAGAGLRPNIALLAAGILMFGIFNAVFLTMYYKNVKKIGIPFFVAAIVSFVFIMLVMAASFVFPWWNEKVNTPDNVFLEEKLIMLGVCAAAFLLLTFASCKVSVKNFEKQDI